MSIVYTATELAAMPDLETRLPGWAIASIDGTTFDPPMGIEHVGRYELIPGSPDDGHGIQITVWPAKGWMLALDVCSDPGSAGPNKIEFNTD